MQDVITYIVLAVCLVAAGWLLYSRFWGRKSKAKPKCGPGLRKPDSASGCADCPLGDLCGESGAKSKKQP